MGLEAAHAIVGGVLGNGLAVHRRQLALDPPALVVVGEGGLAALGIALDQQVALQVVLVLVARPDQRCAASSGSSTGGCSTAVNRPSGS